MPKTIEVVILEGDPFTDDDRDGRKRIPTPLSQPSMSQDRARKIMEVDASKDLFERPTLDEVADALVVLRGPTHLQTPVDTPPQKTAAHRSFFNTDASDRVATQTSRLPAAVMACDGRLSVDVCGNEREFM